MKAIRFLLVLVLLSCIALSVQAQELNAKVVINRAKVSDTKSEVFDALEKKVTEFLNTHQWTTIQFRENERIQCNFNITVDTYSDTDNSFTGSLLVSSSRPVFNSTYMTTAFSIKDEKFNFEFKEFDQLEFRPEQVDNQLIALLAYYAYVIIGFDLDTMSPLGGTDVMHQAEDIVTAGQNLDYPGWKAFDDNKNRFGIVNDYMDGSMECFRQLNYQYHRKGLDQMAENPDSARQAISESLELLDQARTAKNMTALPQLFSEYKREELISIYSGKGTAEEKNRIYDILFATDASQSSNWEKIKK